MAVFRRQDRLTAAAVVVVLQLTRAAGGLHLDQGSVCAEVRRLERPGAVGARAPDGSASASVLVRSGPVPPASSASTSWVMQRVRRSGTRRERPCAVLLIGAASPDDTIVRRIPAGVAGAITPWNGPMRMIALKAGAALAAGCTMVLKGTEVAPLSSFFFAEAAAEAGLPDGVFNLVSGTGPEGLRRPARPHPSLHPHRHRRVHEAGVRGPRGARAPRQGLLRTTDRIHRLHTDTLARQEVFGPVNVMIPFEDEDDAVAIANDSDYGLAGGVWSADPEHARNVGQRLRTGRVLELTDARRGDAEHLGADDYRATADRAALSALRDSFDLIVSTSRRPTTCRRISTCSTSTAPSSTSGCPTNHCGSTHTRC